ncbi:MAG TPA: pyridoxal-phosphate dependent enzyme [Gammaproteobacteria bacterium]
MKISNIWRQRSEGLLLADRERAPQTPLVELALPALPSKRLIFKDESAHPTGSLKHRLARALLLHGIRKGAINQYTPLFDASSGNTAISEAWFARMLGLPFFAVIPEATSQGKQDLIRHFGGECILIGAGKCCKREAAALAEQHDGYFLDQFLNAAPAVDWHANNLVAEMAVQLTALALPEPDWFVAGAGTGGTATCAGRFFRGRNLRTRLMVVDPEDSAFFDFHARGQHPAGCLCASRVEGIGRPTVEPSFTVSVVDAMAVIPDAASFAAARWLSARLRKSVGISTGTNLIGAIHLFNGQLAAGAGSIATLICDDGARYTGRLDDDAWLAAQGFDIAAWGSALDIWYARGSWQPPDQFSGNRESTVL